MEKKDMKLFLISICYGLSMLLLTTASTDQLYDLASSTFFDGSGAFVATLLRAPGNNDFYFGGTVSPYVWVTSRSYTTLDFSAAIDAAPGQGGP